MTIPMTPFFTHMPTQKLGAHWHLAGVLKSRKQTSPQGGEIILVRKVDALSAHIESAETSQYVIPTVTVTTPSGRTVELYNARVHSETAGDDWQATSSNTVTNELEQFVFTFQKIVVTHQGGKTAGDDWTL